MLDGYSYGWIYFSALGMGLFLASLVRKRSILWVGMGLFILMLSLTGAFISDFYTSLVNSREVLILFFSLSLLFFLFSLKLLLLFPLLVILFSLYFIIWGSSGIYSLEKGVYPVRIICYPTTEQGRSYNIRYANGRETTLGGAGDYLVLEKVTWNRFHVFLPSKTFPVGLSTHGVDELIDDFFLNFTLEPPLLQSRPGMERKLFLIGPIEDDLFYTLWLYKDRRGEPRMTSVKP
jgi:hypothetical protein